MAIVNVDLDGIKYRIKDRLKWGEMMESAQKLVDENIEIDDLIPGVKPKVSLKKVNVQEITMNSVLAALVEWTFRGYDENEELLTEGEVLEINKENLLEIPSHHGKKLSEICEKKTSIPEDTAKKS